MNTKTYLILGVIVVAIFLSGIFVGKYSMKREVMSRIHYSMYRNVIIPAKDGDLVAKNNLESLCAIIDSGKADKEFLELFESTGYWWKEIGFSKQK